MKSFTLSQSPTDVQLTVHVNNYNSTPDKNFVKDFDTCNRFFDAYKEFPAQRQYGAMTSFIYHYGRESIQHFIKEFSIAKAG